MTPARASAEQYFDRCTISRATTTGGLWLRQAYGTTLLRPNPFAHRGPRAEPEARSTRNGSHGATGIDTGQPHRCVGDEPIRHPVSPPRQPDAESLAPPEQPRQKPAVHHRGITLRRAGGCRVSEQSAEKRLEDPSRDELSELCILATCTRRRREGFASRSSPTGSAPAVLRMRRIRVLATRSASARYPR